MAIITQVCKKCQVEKSIGEFYIRKETGKSRRSCKECSNVVCKERNRQKRLDPEYKAKESKKKRQVYWKDIDLSRQKQRIRNQRYYSNNRNAINARKAKWREENREEFNAYMRAYIAKNPVYFRNLARKRRAQEFKATYDVPMPVRVAEILADMQDWLCLYCGVDLHKSGYHLDHRIPLSRNGIHFWTNFQILCPKCNIRKDDYMPWELIGIL